jgi:transposase-like protein
VVRLLTQSYQKDESDSMLSQKGLHRAAVWFSGECPHCGSLDVVTNKSSESVSYICKDCQAALGITRYYFDKLWGVIDVS